jgi:hypothetical protein
MPIVVWVAHRKVDGRAILASLGLCPNGQIKVYRKRQHPIGRA